MKTYKYVHSTLGAQEQSKVGLPFFTVDINEII